MNTDLSLTGFESVLAELIGLCHPSKLKDPEPIDHVVMNCHKLVEGEVDNIRTEIKEAHDNHILKNLDLRVILHPEGNKHKWSLEACSRTKSLALIGTTPGE